MNTETDYLKSIAEEIALKPSTENDNLLPDKYLSTEANRVKKDTITHLLQIDNFPRRETFYYNTLGKLVDICDILFNTNGTITPDVKILLDLITEIQKVIPSEINPKLQLSKAFITIQSQRMTKSSKTHTDIFREQAIEPKLIAIAIIPFKQFAHPVHKLCWRNFTWLKGYEQKLHTIDWENADCNSKTEALISILLNCDFNDDRFFIYCKKYIIQRTSRYGTKKRRLAEFAQCEKLILQDTLDEFPSYNHRRPNISKKLIDWIDLETKAIKANDTFDDEQFKIEFNLDSTSIAIFWKHLMEHGITKTINIDLYAKQIAATSSSKGKEELKWETIKAKFYNRMPKYLKRIADPFAAIISDIKRFLK